MPFLSILPSCYLNCKCYSLVKNENQKLILDRALILHVWILAHALNHPNLNDFYVERFLNIISNVLECFLSCDLNIEYSFYFSSKNIYFCDTCTS